ncbi:MAG: hypothetical protein AB8H86_23180, partial [Polyangiales bacterium]
MRDVRDNATSIDGTTDAAVHRLSPLMLVLVCSSLGCSGYQSASSVEGCEVLSHQSGAREECMFGVCDETVPLAPRWSAAGRGVALWFGGITGAYEVELNGAPVAGEGSFDPLTEVVGVSDIVVLPERLLRGDGTDALTVRFADSWFGRLSHSDWIIGDAFVIQNLQNQRAQSEGSWLVALVMLHGIFALFALVLAVFSRRLSTAMLVPMFGIFCFWKLYEHPLAADWGLLTSGVYRAYLLSIFPAVALAGAFTLSHTGAGGRSGLRALGAWALATLLVCCFAFQGLSSAQVYTACELSSVALLALVVGQLI